MEHRLKKAILFMLSTLIAVALPMSYAFAEPVVGEEEEIGTLLSEELPPGGWTPPESHYVEDMPSVPELPVLRAVPEDEDDVFIKGACSVGYDALNKEGQKKFYEELDLAARSFAFSDTDLSPTPMKSSGVCTDVYVYCTINYASKGLTSDEARQAFFAYDYDHPAYYWLYNPWYNSSQMYIPTYPEYASASERKRINGLVSDGVKDFAKKAGYAEDTLDEIAIIHDLIDSEVEYAYKSDGKTPEKAKWAHSVHGLFDPSHKKVVCEGYADTFSLMMNYLGIPCYYIVGNADGELHAWNAVSDDDGKTYMYMDLTWDDIKDGTYYYKHFGMPKSDFETSHIPYSSDGVVPEWLYELKGVFCDSFEDTYYYKGGFYSDTSECSELIKKANTRVHRLGSIMAFLSDSTTTLSAIASKMGFTLRSYYRESYKGKDYCSFVREMTEKVDLSNAEIVLDADGYAYSGSEVKPQPEKVLCNGIKLIPGLNYEVSYENNIEAGNAAKVIVTGKGGFSGSCEKTFVITDMAIGDDSIDLSTSEFEYDGSSHIPDITVTVKGKVLDKDSDYEVSISGDTTNVGTIIITVTGKGKYLGTIKKTYDILPISISSYEIELSDEKIVYDGSPQMPKVTSVRKAGSDSPIGSECYDVDYADNIAAGLGKVIVYGKGNYRDSCEKPFAIEPADIEKAVVDCKKDDYEYAGTAVEPDISDFTVTLESVVLQAGTDYEISGYADNENVGEATVSFKGIGNYAGTASGRFLIKGKAYKVSFDPQGGRCDVTEKVVLYGGQYGELPIPEYSGYDFEGWFTKAEGGEKIDAGSALAINGNHTLYAHWTPVNSDVDPNGGTNEDPTDAGNEDPTDAGNEGNDEKLTKETDIGPSEDVVFTDPAGGSITLVHDSLSNTYKTMSGEVVLDVSRKDGKSGVAEYQYTTKKITPGKGSFIIYDGVVYRYKTDYTISYKKNKTRGTATVKTKWKKGSLPYSKGEKTVESEFKIVPRVVSSDMVNVLMRGRKLKITVNADGKNMKLKKADYSYSLSGNGIKIEFSNNYSGEVYLKYSMGGSALVP